jgi:hypothetical protein
MKRKKKKIIHIERYDRFSYGVTRPVAGHYRGHGLSKSVPNTKGRAYMTGGKKHLYSPARDRARRAKHTRKYGKASWRGDRKGSRI